MSFLQTTESGNLREIKFCASALSMFKLNSYSSISQGFNLANFCEIKYLAKLSCFTILGFRQDDINIIGSHSHTWQ